MSAVFHRSLSETLPLAVAGEGAYIVDDQGRRYLDASGGAAVSCIGHSHPAVIAAVQAQVAQLPYASSAFFRSEAAETLAARLIARAPAGFGAGRAIFVGSGSEAMEAALKLARQYHLERQDPARVNFIARRMSYHGNTLGALAVGGHAARRAPYAPMLMPATHIAPCYAYRFRNETESETDYALRTANELETEILRLGPGTVAAFIAEPVVGATLGCVTAVPGYFQRIREICDRHGVLFIADEIMCGMGRTGTLFALEHDAVCPDIVTVAKGLGGGYQPIGAALASARVVAAIAEGSGVLANGHTYMSHPIACAASLAVLDVIESEDLLPRVVQQGATLNAALQSRFGQHPHVGDIRGRGLFQALELVQDRDTKAPFPLARGLADRVRLTAQGLGLICYPSAGTADGENGDHIILSPPYTIESPQLVEMVDRLDQAIALSLAA